MSAESPTKEAAVKADSDEEFAAGLSTEFSVQRGGDGTVTVKDVPIFGENERSSFAGDLKYDASWLKKAHKVDEDLRKGNYKAPMHFGHHTGMGGSVERAGHYEITGVKKVKLHDKKINVAFANLVFKNEETFEKYKNDYPYRSVEISHERPDQINSLALLSSEAPYFQFPIGEHKFGVEVGAGEKPKAHYFAWQGGLETFAGFPPKKAAGGAAPHQKSGGGAAPHQKASQPPKYGDEAPEGQSDGADGMAASENGQMDQSGGVHNDIGSHNEQPGTNQNDVVVATLGAMMELLNKLVDHTIKKDSDNPNDSHEEPDGDEPEASDEDEHSEEDNDGEEKMPGEKDKKQPVVAASADVASMEGKIAALEAELTRMKKERENDALFASLRSELASYGIANLDVELRKHVDAGTAQAWATGVKQIAPPARTAEAPKPQVEDPAIAEFMKSHPKADPVLVREFAAIYNAAPEGHLIRKHKLERFIEAQIEMGN